MKSDNQPRSTGVYCPRCGVEMVSTRLGYSCTECLEFLSNAEHGFINEDREWWE